MNPIYLLLWYNNYVDFAILLHLFGGRGDLKQIQDNIMFYPYIFQYAIINK